MILTIASRELRGGLVTPLIWVLLGGGQVVLAWIFHQTVENFSGLGAEERVASLSQELSVNLFGFAAVVALFAHPDRHAHAERRVPRRQLRPDRRGPGARLVQVVLGKFLGAVALMTPLALLPALNLLLLAGSADLDPGLFAAATLGLWLTGLLFASVGLFASSLSSQPGAAVLAAYGILLLFSVIGRAQDLAIQGLSCSAGWPGTSICSGSCSGRCG